MGETKIALVPWLVVTGLTQRRYGLLLTDLRALFVLQRSISLPVMWAALGGGGVVGILLATLADVGFTTSLYGLAIGMALGMGAARAAMRERIPDYAALSPDELAVRKGALSIPYASIQGLSLEKNPRISSRLRLTYLDRTGALHELRALLIPDMRWMQSRFDAGAKGRAVFAEYVESVRQALLRALPPEVVLKVNFT